MNTITISRRRFAQLLGAGAAAAVARPALSFATPKTFEVAAASKVVRLSANENPYGPSPKALQAITDSFGLACRYPDEHNNVLIEKLAKLNELASYLITPSTRYSKPELQTHITYLYSLTTATDQKIGQDAVDRYTELRKELDRRVAELNGILGPEK